MGSPAHVKYDIPSEWQFDFAARGGLSTEKIEDIINTGIFGSLDLNDNDLDEFKKFIPCTGDYDNGQGRTKSLKPFPREIGPHDLIGHLFTWTKSIPSLLGFDRFSSKTNPKKYFGLDWNLENRKIYPSSSFRIVHGAFWNSSWVDLLAGKEDIFPLSSKEKFLGLRLLRTNHAPQKRQRK